MSMSAASLALLAGAITASLLGYQQWPTTVVVGPEKAREPTWTPAPPPPLDRLAPAPAEKPLKPPAPEAPEGGSWWAAVFGGAATLAAGVAWLWTRNRPVAPARVAELCPEFPSPRRVAQRRRTLGSVAKPQVLEGLATLEYRR